MDNTIVRSNVVQPYVLLRTRHMPFLVRLVWYPLMICRVLLFLILDRLSRSFFNMVFYRLYRGRDASSSTKRHEAQYLYDMYYEPHLIPLAVAAIEKYKNLGVRVVLVTGGLDWMMAPVAERLGAEAVLATVLEVR